MVSRFCSCNIISRSHYFFSVILVTDLTNLKQIVLEKKNQSWLVGEEEVTGKKKFWKGKKKPSYIPLRYIREIRKKKKGYQNVGFHSGFRKINFFFWFFNEKKKLFVFLVFRELKEKKKAFFPLVFLLVTRKKIFKGKKKQKGNLFLVFREFKKKKKGKRLLSLWFSWLHEKKKFKEKKYKRKEAY